MSAVKVVIEEALCAYEFFRLHGHSYDEVNLHVAPGIKEQRRRVFVEAVNFEIECGSVVGGADALKALDLWPYAVREWQSSAKGDLAKQRTRIWEGSIVSRDYVKLSEAFEKHTRYIIP